MIDGNDGIPKFQKIIRTGAPLIKAIPSIASTVAGLVSMINTEMKFVDTNINGNFSKPAFILQNLNLITQGDDESNRIGRSIRAVNLTVRISINMNLALNNEIVRVMVVCDKSLDPGLAETPTIILSKILEDSTVAPVVSPLNKDYGKRFVLMKDKVFTLNANTRTNFVQKWFMRCGFHIKFDSGSSGDASENSIYFVVISDNNSVTNESAINTVCRLNYTDT